MKYIIYHYEDAFYAVPCCDAAEVAAAEELLEEYSGRFRRVGTFESEINLNVSPVRKWYGFELLREESPFLRLVKKTARNADFL